MCIRLSLISDVNVEDDYVEFILNGNAGSFQVKRVTELKCEFLSGKTIFEYEEMKNLSMDVSGYVKYDIDYPEGWTVEFDGTKMSVTAPAAPSEWNQTPFDESDTAALVSQITSNGNSSTEEFEINRYMYTTVYVYITWTDAEGNYYAPVKVEIPMPA